VTREDFQLLDPGKLIALMNQARQAVSSCAYALRATRAIGRAYWTAAYSGHVGLTERATGQTQAWHDSCFRLSWACLLLCRARLVPVQIMWATWIWTTTMVLMDMDNDHGADGVGGGAEGK
jgi:hypothetical protein